MTLLVGANNSGKTNFFKALSFLSSYLNTEKSQQESISRESFHQQNTNEKISFTLFFSDLVFEIKLAQRGIFFERLFDISNFRNIHFFTKENSIDFIDRSNLSYGESPKSIQNIKYFKYYTLKADKIADINELDETIQISKDGYGVANALDRIRGEFPEIYTQIEERFKTCIPEVSRILLKSHSLDREAVIYGTGNPFNYLSEENYTTYKYRGIGKSIGIEENGLKFYGPNVSDGVLLLLAILTIANHPTGSKIICIEEPENGIHPRRVGELIDHLTDLSYNSNNPIQIIMSSHSSYVLNCFRDRLDEVVVVEKENGETVFKSLSEHKDLINFGDGDGLSLGDIWYSGLVGGVPK